jgi:hypothetical protein
MYPNNWVFVRLAQFRSVPWPRCRHLATRTDWDRERRVGTEGESSHLPDNAEVAGSIPASPTNESQFRHPRSPITVAQAKEAEIEAGNWGSLPLRRCRNRKDFQADDSSPVPSLSNKGAHGSRSPRPVLFSLSPVPVEDVEPLPPCAACTERSIVDPKDASGPTRSNLKER